MSVFDLLIVDGLIVDGTGRAGYRADVGIAGDRIAAVGELPRRAGRILSAEGCVVAPGFIDIHSHTDASVLVNPSCESKITQGVTTELSGNC
ncbi:MAG: D-aminoacylase, partial [Armatimonadota bacterium]